VLIRGVESNVNSSGACGRAEAEPGPTAGPEGALGGDEILAPVSCVENEAGSRQSLARAGVEPYGVLPVPCLVQ
jgi:hypothetical protein